MAAISPVSSSTVTNTANGSFEKAVEGDNATTKATTGGAMENASADGSIKPGQGDFFGDAVTKLPIGDDLFE